MAKIKICLDAGHYGKYNQSEVVPAFYESDFNWKFHLLLKKYLEQCGIEVITTRTDKNKDMDLYQRGRAAKGCNVFLSIHANWAERKDADYVVCYVPLNHSGDELGKALAECVGQVMGTKEYSRINTKQSTKGPWDWYGVIYGAVDVGVPGIIIEHSFYSNKKMAEWLMNDANLDLMARKEANVIAKHFNLAPLKEEVTETVAPTTTVSKADYRAISGAYSIRANADTKLATVRKIYPDAIMIKVDNYYKIQIGAFTKSADARAKVAEVKAKGLDCYVSTDKEAEIIVGNTTTTIAKPSTTVTSTTSKYTHEQFVKEVQAAIGAKVDGKAGSETLSKTVTLSASKNRKHAAVKPVQKWLYELGYTNVGTADGIAGTKFTSAVGNYQQDNGCYVDGEITAKNKTWRKLLRME